MLKIHKYLLIVILSNIQGIWSASTAERLANLEIERINNQNINTHQAQDIVNNNTHEIDRVLIGATGEVNFNRCASAAEWEQVRIHVINKYATLNKILKQNKVLHEYALNDINQKWLSDNTLKDKYARHLFNLYILEFTAYEITLNNYSYLSGMTQFEESIAGNFFIAWRNGVGHHPFIQDYITNNFENIYSEKFQIYYDKNTNKHDDTNHYYSTKFKSMITKILGDNFMSLYHGLLLNINNVAPEEKEAIKFMRDYRQSPYQFIKLNASKHLDNLNISNHEFEFLTALRSAYGHVACTNLTRSQSVHQYNQSFVKPNLTAVNQIQQNFSVIIERLNKDGSQNTYEFIKKDMKEYTLNNSQRLNPYTPNLDIKNSINTTFANLDKHFTSQGYSETSETHLNVILLLEFVYSLSKKIDNLLLIRNQTLINNFFSNDRLNKNIDLHRKLLAKLTDKNFGYFDGFILSFAANHYDGGWCYPGIAGRLFRDYCKMLTDFILDSLNITKTITIEEIKESLQLRAWRGLQ